MSRTPRSTLRLRPQRTFGGETGSGAIAAAAISGILAKPGPFLKPLASRSQQSAKARALASRRRQLAALGTR